MDAFMQESGGCLFERYYSMGGSIPSEEGLLKKPLVGRMAFTPLTRGARGVGFQPREGERDG